MQPTMGKSNFLKNLIVQILLFGVFILLFRLAYVVAIISRYCDAGDFCFFPLSDNLYLNIAGSTVVVVNEDRPFVTGASLHDLWTSEEWRNTVDFYSSVFQDHIAEGYISPDSKAICIDETLTGQDVFALKEIGVSNAIGISNKAFPPLVVSGQAFHQPFDDNSFDFEFSGAGGLDRSVRPSEFASEIGRTLKPQGVLVVHTASANDVYSLNSFLRLFNCCRLVRSRMIDGGIHELVLKKDNGIPGNSISQFSVLGYKHQLVQKAEPIITVEPLKPWITLKMNLKNIKYLSSMVDISFKQSYVYIDVGARNYGSSIGSWFKKEYPKQNKTFEIYAIEADKAFHEEYQRKKGVNLLPYAAWVRNESLFFEINRNPVQKIENKGGEMGRIRHPVQSSASFVSDVNKILGFDFANWLKNTVSERDFVVMKMDVEGTEFDLIPRLFETGAINLIDEIFLECHYNRWQKCCPGERSYKYQKTYEQCLELFSSLRQNGVLVHQWW